MESQFIGGPGQGPDPRVELCSLQQLLLATLFKTVSVGQETDWCHFSIISFSSGQNKPLSQRATLGRVQSSGLL